MEHIRCNLCGYDNTKLLFRRRDMLIKEDKSYNVVKCTNCGLVYINPRQTEKEIAAYYTKDYYEIEISPKELILKKISVLNRKYGKIKNLVNTYPKRILDIGCQKGEFLNFCKENGWEVYGVEKSDIPPDLFGLNIFRGDIFQAHFPDNFFDVITMWAVLEHVYSPYETLKKINRITKPGGFLVISVPNFRSITMRLMRYDDIPRHTTMFTPSTIKKMLNKAGFDIVKFEFSTDIFSGSLNGAFTFFIRLLRSRNFDDVLYKMHLENLNRKKYGVPLYQSLCEIFLGIILYGPLERILSRLGLTGTMTVYAVKRGH